MGLLGVLGFVLQCFDVLAWPLFALLYPLYSSIRAIETNSISDTHKLNTYWVVFSLILLFEHAFMKLLECCSLWPYMRLLFVFFLVIPHFDGALYVFKHLICPCLSMDPQIIFSLFKKRKESLVRENFLSEVERYVKENGYEGLEKSISCKSISIKPNGGQHGMQVMVKKKETTDNQVSEAEPILTVNKDRSSAMQMKEKTIEVAADRRILETPPSKKVQKELTAVSVLATQTDAKNN
uniref:HVA22-like protein a isoform X1 n=1 Tax=Fragaria vesca subsp. vesca TaxID=101020 RepID=UPI0005CB1597|nr:PREDICTED: HVA22-like protein a isoform X1 [Fragaria vesca subsp. vesca]